MTAALALVMVTSWGCWIPLAQLLPGVPQGTRTLYATAGNAIFAAIALLAGGGHVDLGWRGWWLPLAGGLIWTAGSYSAFRASADIGLARAAGTWTPLNIIVAFIWGALLFGELDHFSVTSFVVLGVALLAVLAGVLLIVGAQGSAAAAADDQPDSGQPGSGQPGSGQPGSRTAGSATGRGLAWAAAAGVLWGSYFIPAQWAAVPAQVGDFPLAIGMLIAGLAVALPSGDPVLLSPRPAATQLAAGAVFGIGNLALLGLVTRVGTGAGFTIGQLSLLVNASIGIWFFHVPEPGTRQARRVLAGILLAGLGGCVIGALR
jgi:glucose uptake protein